MRKSSLGTRTERPCTEWYSTKPEVEAARCVGPQLYRTYRVPLSVDAKTLRTALLLWCRKQTELSEESRLLLRYFAKVSAEEKRVERLQAKPI